MINMSDLLQLQQILTCFYDVACCLCARVYACARTCMRVHALVHPLCGGLVCFNAVCSGLLR